MLKIIITLILIPILTLTFFEGRKAYWDYQVDKMCEKDGGIKINNVFMADSETLELMQNKFGDIRIPKEGSDESIGSPLIHTNENVSIHDGNPSVSRSQISVIRVVDNVVIATKTTYYRIGGDLYALHPTNFTCPKYDKEFFSSVVVKKDLSK